MGQVIEMKKLATIGIRFLNQNQTMLRIDLSELEKTHLTGHRNRTNEQQEQGNAMVHD